MAQDSRRSPEHASTAIETAETSRAHGEGVATAWTVVGISTIVNTLAWGVRATFALLYIALLDEFGVGPRRDGIRLLAELARVRRLRPIAGWLFDRHGARLIVAIGGVILGAALALTGAVLCLPSTTCALGFSGPRASPA